MRTAKGDRLEISACDGDPVPCVLVRRYLDRPRRGLSLDALLELGVADWRAREIIAEAEEDAEGPVLVDELHLPAADAERFCEEVRAAASDALAGG